MLLLSYDYLLRILTFLHWVSLNFIFIIFAVLFSLLTSFFVDGLFDLAVQLDDCGSEIDANDACECEDERPSD